MERIKHISLFLFGIVCGESTESDPSKYFNIGLPNSIRRVPYKYIVHGNDLVWNCFFRTIHVDGQILQDCLNLQVSVRF